MPECYRETIKNGIEVAIWAISETEAELRKGLSLSEKAQSRLSSRRSEVHRKGYLAIRQLLKGFHIDPLTHQYDKQGAPYLTDGRFLSISHTQTRATVALGTVPLGIDLEFYQDKIEAIAPRFLNPSELAYAKENEPISIYTQLWTAKEALYKAYNTPGIHFATQMHIHGFENKASEGLGSISHQEKEHPYSLYFRYFDTFCLTLATPKQV